MVSFGCLGRRELGRLYFLLRLLQFDVFRGIAFNFVVFFPVLGCSVELTFPFFGGSIGSTSIVILDVYQVIRFPNPPCFVVYPGDFTIALCFISRPFFIGLLWWCIAHLHCTDIDVFDFPHLAFHVSVVCRSFLFMAVVIPGGSTFQRT